MPGPAARRFAVAAAIGEYLAAMTAEAVLLAIGIAAVVGAVALGAGWLRRRTIATPGERAVYGTLHTAAAAGSALHSGLTAAAAAAAAPLLRELTAAAALGIYAADAAPLAWHGPGGSARDALDGLVADAISGRRRVLAGSGPALIAQPMFTDADEVVGALGVVIASEPGPGTLGVVSEVGRYAARQIELADLDSSRARLDRAEAQMLRAQISPHFIYNALNTIASFVRTDPDRARELILEFADFTRYSFRTAGEFTVLADELRNIDRYLTLERARFGETLRVRIQIAPEVLTVALPFLALQPIVENAVRHGISKKPGGGTISVVATDEGADCVIAIEDDGVGMDPDLLRSGALDALRADVREVAHVGLANVDNRMRAIFGNDYGLVVETALGAGTRVLLRVPKFRPGIQV